MSDRNAPTLVPDTSQNEYSEPQLTPQREAEVKYDTASDSAGKHIDSLHKKLNSRIQALDNLEDDFKRQQQDLTNRLFLIEEHTHEALSVHETTAYQVHSILQGSAQLQLTLQHLALQTAQGADAELQPTLPQLELSATLRSAAQLAEATACAAETLSESLELLSACHDSTLRACMLADAPSEQPSAPLPLQLTYHEQQHPPNRPGPALGQTTPSSSCLGEVSSLVTHPLAQMSDSQAQAAFRLLVAEVAALQREQDVAAAELRRLQQEGASELARLNAARMTMDSSPDLLQLSSILNEAFTTINIQSHGMSQYLQRLEFLEAVTSSPPTCDNHFPLDSGPSLGMRTGGDERDSYASLTHDFQLDSSTELVVHLGGDRRGTHTSHRYESGSPDLETLDRRGTHDSHRYGIESPDPQTSTSSTHSHSCSTFPSFAASFADSPTQLHYRTVNSPTTSGTPSPMKFASYGYGGEAGEGHPRVGASSEAGPSWSSPGFEEPPLSPRFSLTDSTHLRDSIQTTAGVDRAGFMSMSITSTNPLYANRAERCTASATGSPFTSPRPMLRASTTPMPSAASIELRASHGGAALYTVRSNTLFNTPKEDSPSRMARAKSSGTPAMTLGDAGGPSDPPLSVSLLSNTLFDTPKEDSPSSADRGQLKASSLGLRGSYMDDGSAPDPFSLRSNTLFDTPKLDSPEGAAQSRHKVTSSIQLRAMHELAGADSSTELTSTSDPAVLRADLTQALYDARKQEDRIAELSQQLAELSQQLDISLMVNQQLSSRDGSGSGSDGQLEADVYLEAEAIRVRAALYIQQDGQPVMPGPASAGSRPSWEMVKELVARLDSATTDVAEMQGKMELLSSIKAWGGAGSADTIKGC